MNVIFDHRYSVSPDCMNAIIENLQRQNGKSYAGNNQDPINARVGYLGTHRNHYDSSDVSKLWHVITGDGKGTTVQTGMTPIRFVHPERALNDNERKELGRLGKRNLNVSGTCEAIAETINYLSSICNGLDGLSEQDAEVRKI